MLKLSHVISLNGIGSGTQQFLLIIIVGFLLHPETSKSILQSWRASTESINMDDRVLCLYAHQVPELCTVFCSQILIFNILPTQKHGLSTSHHGEALFVQ